MRRSARRVGPLLLALLLSSCSVAAVEPPPGVGQWMSGILANRDQVHAIARAHRDAMSHVDGQLLSAELAMVCRAVELAAKDARVRGRTGSDSVASRVRASVLPHVAARLKARTECVAGSRRSFAEPPADLATRIDAAVALLDFDDDELRQVHDALAGVEKTNGDMNEAILEVGDWATRYDELVRSLAAMNLALRHAHHGQSVGAGERAFERLRELLDTEE